METKNKSTIIKEYWEAFERLKKNTPIRIAKGSPINNDNVALEAGRKRGSIKKSRNSHSELIKAINDYNISTVKKSNEIENKIIKLRTDKRKYKELYLQMLNRELMLVEQLANLEKELLRFKNVVPFPQN